MPTCPNCKFEWGEVPPPEPLPPTGKPFPWKVTFENGSDQGAGAAAILFRELKAGFISAVTVNGEAAREGVPYKGGPVFLMSKPGEEYARPLNFVIRTNDGQTYIARSGSSPSAPGTPPPATGEYRHKETYTSYGVRNGGRQAWRIPKKGPDFDNNLKIVFANGQTFVIPDVSKNFRDIDGSRTNKSDPRRGFVFKPGIGPNGEGDNDTGTSHGGVYLHAPYGNSSKTVTFYYNKP